MYHIHTPETLEKKAEKILTEYEDGALLTSPQAMDVDHFAEFYLGATVDFANLSQDMKTLGCTCFNDGKLMVWNDERTKEIPLDVKKGFIFVDNKVINESVEGRVRFTIIHECSHLILHPRFHYQKPGTVTPKINCTVYHIEEWTKRPPMTDEEVREWQANRLGAALIMPAQTVKMLTADKLGVGLDSLVPVYLSEIFIQGMADVFQVSKTAMRNRLRDLDLWQSGSTRNARICLTPTPSNGWRSTSDITNWSTCWRTTARRTRRLSSAASGESRLCTVDN